MLALFCAALLGMLIIAALRMNPFVVVGDLIATANQSWGLRDDLGKVSLVGAGMKSHPGVAAKTFATLEENGIVPAVVSTSPIKIACHVRTDEVERAVRALHEAFELG